jgi:hypothetical protein
MKAWMKPLSWSAITATLDAPIVLSEGEKPTNSPVNLAIFA